MQAPFEEFCSTLKKTFMLDVAEELDFGIYRIMNLKRKDIEDFLDNKLKGMVEQEIENNISADYESKKKKLDDMVATLTKLHIAPEMSPDYLDLHRELENMGDPAQMQASVFTHLDIFFNRYYDRGDFISKRRYSSKSEESKYAIPYNGEEVKLYWANQDQYYIKNGQYFHDYRFRLANGRVVEFTLKEATDVEQNDNKQSKRELVHHFKIYEEEPVELTEDGVLHINFVFQLMGKTPNQSTLNNQTAAMITSEPTASLVPFEFAELTAVKRSDDGKNYTLLQKQLNRYTAKNSYDYFIHKDLKGFLCRELDFYIKNDVLNIDDMLVDTVKRELTVAKAIKSIGSVIIRLLAQLEDFQKRLWLKKKVVASADYCVTLDRIWEGLTDEMKGKICQNDAQREEWIKYCGIDQIKGDMYADAYSVPLTPKFLSENQKLVLDTAHFKEDRDFKHQIIQILSKQGNLENAIDGLLIKSENFQALRLLEEKYRGKIKCIYIDPPYNTGNDDFAYKDNYQESSWLSCMNDRLLLCRPFFAEGGSIAVSIDIKEVDKLISLLDAVLGIENRKANITVRRASISGPKVINPGMVNISENVIIYANGNGKWKPQDAYREKNYDNRYNQMIVNPGDEPSKWKFSTVLEEFAKYKGIKKTELKKALGKTYEDELLKFAIDNSNGIMQKASLDLDSVGNDAVEAYKKSKADPKTIYHIQRDGFNDYYILNGKAILFYKDRLRRMGDRIVPVEKVSDIWDDVLPNDIHNEGGVVLKKGKKPEKLVDRIIESTTNPDDLVMDFFAGSATSGAVALKSGHKFINVECNEYFDNITLRRIKNALYGDTSGVTDLHQWKGGGVVKYLRLEQYEDTLNNLELSADLGPNHNTMFDKDYLLGYKLDTETRDSLLSRDDWFAHPFDVKMDIALNNERDKREVDLPETFNYLLGLYVEKECWPQAGLQVIQGHTRSGEDTLVIWRDVDIVDNDALMAFVATVAPDELKCYRRIYVNGENTLAASLAPSVAERVMNTDEEFQRLMFTED
ncbi:MAG: site-specific DNA-methyltransferase [Prevotella sp.]|nr:site-specific DNA-methyltransferase [Prevotella sp.]